MLHPLHSFMLFFRIFSAFLFSVYHIDLQALNIILYIGLYIYCFVFLIKLRTRPCLTHVSSTTHYISPTSRHVSSTSCPRLTTSHPRLAHVSPRLAHVSPTSRPCLTHTSPMFHHVLPKSRHVSSMSLPCLAHVWLEI